jgi:hypothetical protein
MIHNSNCDKSKWLTLSNFYVTCLGHPRRERTGSFTFVRIHYNTTFSYAPWSRLPSHDRHSTRSCTSFTSPTTFYHTASGNNSSGSRTQFTHTSSLCYAPRTFFRESTMFKGSALSRYRDAVKRIRMLDLTLPTSISFHLTTRHQSFDRSWTFGETKSFSHQP